MSQHFHLVVEDDPQALLRVVGLFAQRSLVPETLTVERTNDRLHIAIAVAGLNAGAADILVARLREGVTVLDASRQDAGATLADWP